MSVRCTQTGSNGDEMCSPACGRPARRSAGRQTGLSGKRPEVDMKVHYRLLSAQNVEPGEPTLSVSRFPLPIAGWHVAVGTILRFSVAMAQNQIPVISFIIYSRV